eukprot:gnl/Dysnectes_brevis/3219_a4024_566.p1 GENE.gnl/Dysnectes_brevis/3219_a4024_566~~gnl/Dysnectes_brevis/3219_a4024_566.p1  ORF type:complete len:339 (+),score=88.67 gnl/Dysnectes_brevis/3219_a4024_566:195-1211(+)
MTSKTSVRSLTSLSCFPLLIGPNMKRRRPPLVTPDRRSRIRRRPRAQRQCLIDEFITKPQPKSKVDCSHWDTSPIQTGPIQISVPPPARDLYSTAIANITTLQNAAWEIQSIRKSSCMKRVEPSTIPRIPPRKSKHKLTLVLDMDQTLLYSSDHPTDLPGVDDICFGQNGGGVAYSALRPHARTFLAWAAEHFEVLVWTAGLHEYAFPRIKDLNGGIAPGLGMGMIKYMLTRKHCSVVNDRYIKDLSLLGKSRPLDTVMIIDDQPASYGFQPGLGIPIKGWTGKAGDRMLLSLVPVLRKVLECGDSGRAIQEAVLKRSVFRSMLQQPAYGIDMGVIEE